MDLASLDLQLQNNIIMYSRPTYPYVNELNGYNDWYDGEDAFHQENKIRWVLDAIKLKREILKDFYCRIDIACNFLEEAIYI